MKHIKDGLKVGLGMDVKGKTFINIDVFNETKGISKTIKFLIDTGFDGYLQLNKKDVDELGLNMTHESESIIADGTKMKTGITKTKIKILDQEITNFPIQFVENALPLIGTQLLRDTKKMIIFDYTDGYVTLTQDSNLKIQIKSLIEEKSK